MRQHPLEASTTPLSTEHRGGWSSVRWRQGAWALGASVLAHGWVLQALTTPPEHGSTDRAVAADRADARVVSPPAQVAVLTPTRQAAPLPDPGPMAHPTPAAAAGRATVTTPTAMTAAPGAASSDSPSTSPAPIPITASVPTDKPAAGTQMVSTATPAAPSAGATTEAPGASAGPAALNSLAASLTAPAQAATAGDDDTQPPPVYATRTPPPFRLTYALRRGAMSGQAELSLKRPGAGYELELRGTALGIEVLGMSSRGSFGAPGFMPERFVDRRRGKDRLAANFDHAAGRITYSGPPVAQPLLPGAQDRLSWMVQLAAIIDAAPTRYPAGSRIALSVSGARGDVDTWTFIVQGRQRISLPGGTVADALRLTREPRRPYDTQVETWMDPAQHHLPVRARLTVLPGGETLELSLAGS